MTIAETRNYYRGESVIHRMLEFCGVDHQKAINFSVNGEALSQSKELQKLISAGTSEFLVGWGGQLLRERGNAKQRVRNFSLGWILDKGLDAHRSLWDKENTLGVIDVEYFSERYPGEAFARQEDVFWRMEPFYQCVKDLLFSYGIKPLTVATGQGYHFDFRVSKNSPAHKMLEEIASPEGTIMDKYRHLSGDVFTRKVSEQEGKGFEGIGKAIEFIIYEAIRKSPEYKGNIPLSIGDIPSNNEKREGINIDLSLLCGPLNMRSVRIPFSSYHKHKASPWKVGEQVSREIPVQITLPRYTPCNNNELLLYELFNNRRHFHNSANYAGAVTTQIPEVNEGIANLIKSYKKSELFKFHKVFDSEQHDSPERWQHSYDRYHSRDARIESLLRNPAPALLVPANIQYLTRRLMHEGWHPKHIAGLLRSKYERDHGWAEEKGGNWDFYKRDAATHANKWVRFYSGLITTGLDYLVTRG